MIIIELHTVPSDTAPTRFSDYAIGLFPAFPSKKSVKRAIKRGEIRIDGEVRETGAWIQPGQKIEHVELAVSPPKPFPRVLPIIYEDEEFAVLNKPAGLPTSGNFYKTAQNAAAFNLTLSSQPDALPWPLSVHRLDRATSGLLIFAKTRSSRIELGKMFERREIEKVYHAVVIGEVEESGYFDQDIEGKEAFTLYKRLRKVRSIRSKWLSLVELEPKTGRTHQLRIHLSSTGFPILGDAEYGREGLILKGKGMFLSAVGLRFTHPLTEAEMHFRIDAPNKFQTFMEGEQRRWENYPG